MLKALLKKQFLETVSALFTSAKTGKKRSPIVGLLLAVLLLYAIGAQAYLFFTLSQSLCAPLVSAGLDWVYFALVGILAFTIACVMGALLSKAKLYEAKDNELLLAMPVKPSAILLARMIGLYAFDLLFVALVFLPAIIEYFIVTGFSVLPFAFCLITTLILPLGALALGALLGWLIAWLSAKLRAKNLLTYLVFILFFVGYFYLTSKMNEALSWAMANGNAMGESLSGVFVLRWIGEACAGDTLSLLFFVLLFGGAFALVYFVLVKTFLATVTMQTGERKRAYKERKIKRGSAFFSLFKKEVLRTVKSPMVLLNAGIGSILAVIACVLVLVNADLLSSLSNAVGTEEASVIVCIVACFIASSNVVTASSVSLEGENIWILQTAPVDTRTVFLTKIAWHFVLTALPTTVCAIIACAVLGTPFFTAVTVVLAVWAVTLFCAGLGLLLNLKMPNLHWTNETAAVKQSPSALLALFGGWASCALLIGGYFWLGAYIPAWGYLLAVTALFALAFSLPFVWVMKRGVKIWETL